MESLAVMVGGGGRGGGIPAVGDTSVMLAILVIAVIAYLVFKS